MPIDGRYTATPAAFACAIAQAATQRTADAAAALAAEVERYDGILMLTSLVDRFGIESIERWIRSLKAGGVR